MRAENLTTRVRLLLLLALLGAAMCVVPRARAQASPSEYHVKAAFLVNFAQYIEWPRGAFADAEAPILVGVLGDDPFREVLDQVLGEATAQGRRFAVRRRSHVDELRGCHLIFVSHTERDRHSEILASLKDQPVVTVGETPGFARRGGIINFFFEGKKIRFEINDSAAERKRLKISSQLLKRASKEPLS